MLLTCLLVSHALLPSSQSHTETEVKVHNRRASVILEMIEKGQLSKSGEIKADDAKSCLIVDGSAADVAGVQQLVNLFDVARRKVTVKVHLNSPLDKENYDLSGKIYNNAEWKSTYGESGLEFSVLPRINDDGTITAFIKVQTKELAKVSLVYRMKTGTTNTFVLSSEIPKVIVAVKEGSSVSADRPSFTVRFED